APVSALHPDPSTVRLHRQLAEGQTQPRRGPPPGPLRSSELAEDDVVISRGDTEPIVANGEADAMRVVGPFRLQPYVNRSAAMAQCVPDQVRECPPQQVPVREDRLVDGCGDVDGSTM